MLTPLTDAELAKRVAALTDNLRAEMLRRFTHRLEAGFLYPEERQAYARAAAALAAEEA